MEDFEDEILIEGLGVEIADRNGHFTGVGVTELPTVFDPVTSDPFGDAFVASVWDGSHVLVNTAGNESLYYGSSDWRPVAFYLAGGSARIGFSLQQVTGNHVLYVNGAARGRLEALGCSLGAGRNGYLAVSSDDPAEPIVSVAFGGRGDGFTIDHLVIADHHEVSWTPCTWGTIKACYRSFEASRRSRSWSEPPTSANSPNIAIYVRQQRINSGDETMFVLSVLLASESIAPDYQHGPIPLRFLSSKEHFSFSTWPLYRSASEFR